MEDSIETIDYGVEKKPILGASVGYYNFQLLTNKLLC